MKKQFRILVLALAVLMLVSLTLAACSKSSKSGETKKISIWHVNAAEQDHKLITDAVNRYMADHKDVQVEEVAIASDAYEAKLKAAMGSTNPPDVFISWSGGKLYSYIKAGKVLDMTDKMNKDNYKDRFLDGGVNQVTFDKKIWGVPVENISFALFLYNKEIFAANNIQPPKSYDELLQAAETLKSKGIIPFALANKFKWPGSMYYMYLALRLGGYDTFVNAANRSGGSFEDPAFVKAGEMIQDLVKKGYFNEGYNSIDNDAGQAKQLLYSNKAAMHLMGTWSISEIKSENPEFYGKLGLFPFPAVNGGKGDADDVVGTIGDNFYSISTASKHPDESFQLIQYLIDDTSVKARAAMGKIPPVKNVKVDDPMQQSIIDILNRSKHVQLWYDQYLPPEIAQVHLDGSQALFGLSKTPQELAADQENAAKNYKP